MTGREPGRATVRQHTRRTAHGTTTVRRHTRRTTGAGVEPGAARPPAAPTTATRAYGFAAFGQSVAVVGFAFAGLAVLAFVALAAAFTFVALAVHSSNAGGAGRDDEEPRYTTATPPPRDGDEEPDDDQDRPNDQHDPDTERTPK